MGYHSKEETPIEDLRKLDNEELHSLQSSPEITRKT